MHETTRQRACRIGFVLFGVLPTLAVCAWIVWLHSPTRLENRRQEVERYLTEHCGLLVQVDSFQEALDGTMALFDVSFTDPESQLIVARVRSIEVVHRGNEIVAIISQVDVEPKQLTLVGQTLERQMSRLGTSGPTKVWLEANTLHVKTESAEADRTLSQVQCSIEARQNRVIAAIDWQIVGNSQDSGNQDGSIATLRLVRDREIQPASTSWELDSNGTSLPCSVMSDYLPSLAILGDETQFVGAISCRHVEQKWQVDLTGRFEQLDLDRMVTGRFQHKLTGSATAVLNRVTLRDGWLQSAAGNLRSDSGVISHSLLSAMVSELRVLVPASIEPQLSGLQRYRKLNIGFRLDEGVVALGGINNVLIYSDRMTPLVQIDSAPRPIESLVRTLSPLNRIQVPATQEAYDLLKWLPLPRQTPPAEISSRPNYNPVKLD